MNSLQALWQKEMDCTAPMFAYSMLYPYSDNLNDDSGCCADEKFATNLNFKNWLEGEAGAYRNATEQKIYLLVKMIERQFSRDRFPGVFQSLLAIFNAQIKSLLQVSGNHELNSDEILEISLEKGGTSVLADGYLIDGMIDEKQEDFCFGYGAFLQFADDLQDVEDDLANGHRTLFSQQAELGYLDGLANRLFHLMQAVVYQHLSAPRYQRVRALILNDCCFMILEAIGKTSRFYSPQYTQVIARHFPFTFPYFQWVKTRLKRMLVKGHDDRFLGGKGMENLVD